MIVSNIEWRLNKHRNNKKIHTSTRKRTTTTTTTTRMDLAQPCTCTSYSRCDGRWLCWWWQSCANNWRTASSNDSNACSWNRYREPNGHTNICDECAYHEYVNNLINKIVKISNFSGGKHWIPVCHIRLKFPPSRTNRFVQSYIFIAPCHQNIIVCRISEPARQTWGSLSTRKVYAPTAQVTQHTRAPTSVRARFCSRSTCGKSSSAAAASVCFGMRVLRDVRAMRFLRQMQTPSSVHLSRTHSGTTILKFMIFDVSVLSL